MMESGLKRAAAASFIVHLLFIAVMFVSIGRRAPFVMPEPYAVSLVSPSEFRARAARVAPAKEAPRAAEKGEPEGVRAVEKAPPPKKAPKPAENLTKYREDRIAALQAEKEREEYKAGRIRELEKLARVKKLGEEKGVSATARAVGGGPGIVDAITGSYVDLVSSLIQQEWVFLLQPADSDLEAVVTVRVFKNGSLKITGIERSSGNAVFDRSAIRAVEKASPVPPPPFEMELGVRFIPMVE